MNLEGIFNRHRNSPLYSWFYRRESGALKGALRFHLFRHLVLALGSKQIELTDFGHKHNSSPSEADSARDAMTRLRQLSQQHGFDVTLLLLPVSDSREQMELIKAVAKDAKFKVVDLDEQLREQNKLSRELFVKQDPWHLSVEGHQLVADMMLNYKLFEQ